MKPEQNNSFLTQFLAAQPLSQSTALGASNHEFLALLGLLLIEHLSPEATEALLRLMTAIDTNLKKQALMRGPSLAGELIAERRAEAARESDSE